MTSLFRVIAFSLALSTGLSLAQEALPLPAKEETIPTPPTANPPSLENATKYGLPAVQSSNGSQTQVIDGEIVNPSVKQAPITLDQPLTNPSGGTVVVDPTPTASSVVTFAAPLFAPTASEFSAIYDLMRANRFRNAIGHTVTAAKLSNCLPGYSVEQKVGELISILNMMCSFGGRFQNYRNDSGVSSLAATLLCKRGDRSSPEMVQRLGEAYRRLVTEGGWLPEFHNLIVAANLLN